MAIGLSGAGKAIYFVYLSCATSSLMRLLSGISFGIGIVWFGFPFITDSFSG